MTKELILLFIPPFIHLILFLIDLFLREIKFLKREIINKIHTLKYKK
jgi:hypothetical protein